MTTSAAVGAGGPGLEPTGRALGGRIAAAAAIMVLGRLAARTISVFSTLILVRLLLPDDFGLVALASAAFVIADVLTATNYGIALVRRPTVDRDLYDTAWTMNLLRCALLGGFVAATADVQAALLGDARIAPVLMVVALTVTLDGLVSIGMVRLQREFRFGAIFRYGLAAKLLSFVLTIAFAVLLGNFWCLVLGNLVAKLILIPLSYVLAPHRPRLSLRHWRELFGFSKWTLVMNALMAADGQGPNLVLGRVAGAGAVGALNVAYGIAATPVTELAAPIRGPIYAGYARVLDDAAALRRQFLDGFALLGAVIVPLSVGIALVAPEVERLALGAAWAGTAPLIALCALFALVDGLSHFTFNAFNVLDRQRRLVTVMAALVTVRLPAIVAGALAEGTAGMLMALVATGAVNLLVWHWQAGRLLGHSLAVPMLRLGRTVAAAAAMAAAVVWLRHALPAPTGDAADAASRLAILAAVGATVYVAVGAALWHLAGAPDGPERTLLSVTRRAAGRLAARWGVRP